MARRDDQSGLTEEVIGIYYHYKVTKGGRNLSMAALVAVGDGKGKVGLGYGKARAVPMAIEKASKEARGSMTSVNLVGDTVAHEVTGRHGSSHPGRGGCGGPVRGAQLRLHSLPRLASRRI